jgi:hypothetical protein
MSAQSNVISNGPWKFLKAYKGNKWNLLKNSVITLIGAAFLAASVWVWVEPVAAGDVAMLLIKMALSFGLLSLGFVVINMLDAHENIPVIELDPMRRRLSVTEFGNRGKPKHTTHYLLDELSEITMCDNLLTARDMTGRQVAVVPVHDPVAEKAIRKALSA